MITSMRYRHFFQYPFVIFALLLSHAIPVLTSCSHSIPAHVIAVVKVEAGAYDRFDTPVYLNIDPITHIADYELVLYEVIGDVTVRVPSQIIFQAGRHLTWQLSGQTDAGSIREYQLTRVDMRQNNDNNLLSDKRVDKDNGQYVIYLNNKPVLQYNAATVYPIGELDESLKRSGFIHPLYAPNGAVLTTIQPPDHPHHYGIWNPWTKTSFMGEEIDFWNLRKREGTVRHQGVIGSFSGDVLAGLRVLHQHVAWPDTDKEVVAINEQQTMLVFPLGNGMSMIDFSFILNPVHDITLEEHRYGGFGFRATTQWNTANTDFVTSEGFDRDRADGERARWYQAGGDLPEGYASVLAMGHPSNFNHPEPLRVWPSDANAGQGDLFVNFCPIRNTDWVLSPGQSYLLRYRMIVFPGQMDEHRADALWLDYANPPKINWNLNKQ